MFFKYKSTSSSNWITAKNQLCILDTIEPDAIDNINAYIYQICSTCAS